MSVGIILVIWEYFSINLLFDDYCDVLGCVVYEFIIDCREFKKIVGIEVMDIVKRL